MNHKDNKKTKINAKRGEKIIWIAYDSDMYFQFNDLDLFGVYTTTLKKGEHYYAIFSLADKAFVEGSSPPKIIID